MIPLQPAERPARDHHDHPRLPYEIISRIISLSARPTQLACLYVSRTAHELALPHIYGTLWVDLSVPDHALACLTKGYVVKRDRASAGEGGRGLRGRGRGRGGRGGGGGTSKGYSSSGSGQSVQAKGTFGGLLNKLLGVSLGDPASVSAGDALPGSGVDNSAAFMNSIDIKAGSSTSPIGETNARSPNATSPGGSLGPSPPLPRWFAPNRFQHLTHLTLPTHESYLCAPLLPDRSVPIAAHLGALPSGVSGLYTPDIAPIIYAPQLHTLRIQPTFQVNFLDCCIWRSGQDPSPRPGRPCALVSRLAARRLVLGGRYTGLTRCGGFVVDSATSPFPPPVMGVEEIIVFAGACSGIEMEDHTLSARSSFLDRLGPDIRRLTIILKPGTANDGRWRFRRVAGWEGRIPPSFLWDGLGLACSGQSAEVEVVGLESVDRDWSEMPLAAEVAAVRQAVRESLRKKGVSEGERERRVGRVRFLTADEYTRREGRGCVL